MRLKPIINLNIGDAIKNLDSMFDVKDLTVLYWEDQDSRDMGISNLYFHTGETIKDIIHEAKRFVDRDCVACIEVIHQGISGDKVIYFYDGNLEEILN